jgi:hypothetical protein
LVSSSSAGFFGIPAEEQYNLEVMIEWPGFNNTLAPWNTVGSRSDYANLQCDRGTWNYTTVNGILNDWDEKYLKDARERLQKHVKGLELTIQDVRMMVSQLLYPRGRG